MTNENFQFNVLKVKNKTESRERRKRKMNDFKFVKKLATSPTSDVNLAAEIQDASALEIIFQLVEELQLLLRLQIVDLQQKKKV